jgi:hypothetical protein
LQLLPDNGSDTFSRKLAPTLFQVLGQQTDSVFR